MATAPHLTGILTFAFTDIEGSTARWERDRPAMTGAVRRHDAIVRAAIDEHAPSVTLRRLTALLMLAALAACSGRTPATSGFTPAATPANAQTAKLIDTTPGVIPADRHVPGQGHACLPVEPAAHYTFCFIPSSSQCEIPRRVS